MNRFFPFTVLLFFLSACSPEVPKYVLPPDKMQSLLWDLLRADELANYKMSFDSTWATSIKHQEIYQEIFAIHKIGHQQFQTSLQYYQSNPRLLKRVLDSIQTSGDRLQ